MTVIDTNVQPHFRYNSEIRKYLAPTHKLRSIPDVEQQWYQAPGGDYRQDLYGNGYPGSDPDTVARHLFSEGGADYAILNPLTRGNIADYLLNSRICAAVNDWTAQELLNRIEPFGFFIVMGLVIAGVVGNLWLRPLMGLGYDAINLLLSPFAALLR